MACQLQESAVFAKLGVTEQNLVLEASPSFFPHCWCGEKKECEVDQYSIYEEVCYVTQPLVM